MTAESTGEFANQSFKRVFAGVAVTLLAAGQMFLCPRTPAQAGAPAWPDAQPAAPHRPPDVRAWKKNRDAGEKALDKNDVQAAEPLLEAALAEAENFDTNDYRLAESLEDLGILLAVTGQYADAEPLLRHAATIRQRDPKGVRDGEGLLNIGRDPEADREVRSLRNLGIVCDKLGKYAEAEEIFQHAQKIIETRYGANDFLAIFCIFQRGVLYDVEGKDAQAEPLLKQCLRHFENNGYRYQLAPNGTQIQRTTFRPNYTYTLETLGRLSQICYGQNRTDEAETYFKKLLKMLGHVPDRGSHAFEAALGNLAEVYFLPKNYAAAEAVLKLSAELQEKSPGPKYLTTLQTQMMLADVYEREQKLPVVEALYQRIIATDEKALGPNSSTIVKALKNYALLLRKEKRDAEAETLESRVRGIEQGEIR